MKKSLFLTISIVIVLASGCNAPTGDILPQKAGDYYTITFRQDGQKDVTRSVKAGEALADIPTPTPKDGYTIVWDKTDFSAVSQDVLVLAIASANEYTISFDLTSTLGTIEFDGEEQTVTFDSEYAIEEPSLYGYFFVGWEIKEDGTAFDGAGTYTVASDVTLIPTWEKDED